MAARGIAMQTDLRVAKLLRILAGNLGMNVATLMNKHVRKYLKFRLEDIREIVGQQVQSERKQLETEFEHFQTEKRGLEKQSNLERNLEKKLEMETKIDSISKSLQENEASRRNLEDRYSRYANFFEILQKEPEFA